MDSNWVILEVKSPDGIVQIGSCKGIQFTHDSVIISSAVISEPPGFSSCRMDLVEWLKKNQIFVTCTESSPTGHSTTSWSAFYNSSSSMREIRKGLHLIDNLIMNIGGY